MTIHINECWWGAGSIFGWGKQIPGIGLNKKLVKIAKATNEKITVTIEKDPEVYEVSPVTVVNQSKLFKSTYKARGGVTLLVIPRTSLIKAKSAQEGGDIYDTSTKS